jgi:hypothetical protein
MASPHSGEEVFACLQNLHLFAEHVQNVPQMCLKQLSANQVRNFSDPQKSSSLEMKLHVFTDRGGFFETDWISPYPKGHKSDSRSESLLV